jgi:hypothetical protein
VRRETKRFGVSFLLLSIVLLLVACGPAEPTVVAKAVEINLTAADLGPGFTLVEESDLPAILDRTHIATADTGVLVDADRRVFVSTNVVTATAGVTATQPITRSQVIITVQTYNSSSAASGALGEVRDALKDVLAQNAALIAVNAATIGDQSEFWAAEMPNRGARFYLFLFRRTNVVGIVMAVGPATLEQTWVLGLGQTLANRVPVATTK